MREQLDRLTTLNGTDAGFYVLALHSFVEHYVRDVLQMSDAERFSDLVWEYRGRLMREAGGGFVPGLNCLTSLARQHRLTNQVRHSFVAVAPEEAITATHLFVRFCRLVGIDHLPEVIDLQRGLEAWQNRGDQVSSSPLFQAMRGRLQELQNRNTELLQQLETYSGVRARIESLENGIERFTLELQASRDQTRAKNERVDQLRRERAELRNQRRDLQRQMEGYHELESYIESMGRLSLYTRSRHDYEQSLLRLTPEQEEAVTSLEANADTLVRGGAGTGKSLVLLEALRRRLAQTDLDFGQTAKGQILLTYTRTLAKYEDYVGRLLQMENVAGLVATVDAFFLARLRRLDERYRYDFSAVSSLASAMNDTGFLSNEELSVEVEGFLFGNMVSRDEYLEESIPRVGMRRPLGRKQREVVWDIRDRIARSMEESLGLSRNYTRSVLLRFLDGASAEESARVRDVETIYLDEAQDLTAGDIRALKALSTGHLVMASDFGQSIYGVSPPFTRAGLDLSGRTRVLKTSFRSTRQIKQLADAYSGAATDTFAYRDGPPPELYRGKTPRDLNDMLAGKLKFFVDHLGYEPETICILAPHNAEVGGLAERLQASGYPTTVIADREFSFTQEGQVRLCTLHSSKGLDFPVVMLYLPYIKRREQYDDQATERLLRNLVYVGLTRAMENLSVFVTPGDDPVLGDLCSAFDQLSAESHSLV